MKISTSLLLFLLSICNSLIGQDFTRSPSQNSGLDVMSIADFDGDDDEDIFGISYRGSSTDLILLLSGGTSPISLDQTVIGSDSDIKGGCAAGDYDGDGDIDVIFAKGDTPDLYVLVNQGNATFQELPLSASGSTHFKFGDMEGDGDLDIIGYSFVSNSIQVLINNGMQSYTSHILLTDSSIESFDGGDLDDDGDWDIVIGFRSSFDKQITILENKGDNTFTEKTLIANDFSKLNEISIQDINSDGQLDIVAVNDDFFMGWENLGSLEFKKETLVDYTGTSGFGFFSLDMADFNGDGRLDAVMGDNDGPITWYQNLSINPYEYTKAEVGTVRPANYLHHLDLDLDGDLDIITSNGDFWWYENNLEQTPVSTLELGSIQFKLFPNPFQDYLRLENIIPNHYQLELIDISGKIIHTQIVQEEKIPLSFIQSGIYHLRLTNLINRTQSSAKVVKIK